jgi:hypothetical protein
MLPIACPTRPSRISSNVCKLKDENVVNPPQMPIMIKALPRRHGQSTVARSKSAKQIDYVARDQPGFVRPGTLLYSRYPALKRPEGQS